MRAGVPRIAIATMVGDNQGNRLQNYALQVVLGELSGGHIETLKVGYGAAWWKRMARRMLWRVVPRKRWACFERFNSRYINFSRYCSSDINLNLADYDLYVIGSDQVWNPYFSSSSEADYLPQIEKERKCSYAASFGVSDILEMGRRKRTAELLRDIQRISVREDAGADIVETLIGMRPPVVLDPTLLVDAHKWRKVACEPDMDLPSDGYILKYVLGENISDDEARLISSSSCSSIVDLKDRSLPVGPAEFIWLIEHADYVCTDSFHASVFSILMHTPFAIFERVSKHQDMSSRFDTLCRMFKLEDRRVRNGDISLESIRWEQIEGKLWSARKASLSFLEDCLRLI